MLHRPQKNKQKKPILLTNPRLQAPLPPFFQPTTFRNNPSLTSNPKVHYTAIDSLVLSLRTVWQSGSSFRVLGTATLSLKLQNICGPRSSDLFFLYSVPHFFKMIPPSMSSCRTYERTSSFRKISYRYDVTFFCGSTAVKHSVFFVHISLFFEARIKPIATSAS